MTSYPSYYKKVDHLSPLNYFLFLLIIIVFYNHSVKFFYKKINEKNMNNNIKLYLEDMDKILDLKQQFIKLNNCIIH